MNKITPEFLIRIGFTDKGLNGHSILLPPAPGSEGAIVELFVSEDESGIFVTLVQGFPDDPHAQDDLIRLTSLPGDLSPVHLIRLLLLLGGPRHE